MRAVVKDVMSAHPISVTRDSPFKELAARMFESAVSGFPVVDDDGKVIGVVSEADMLAKEALARRIPRLAGNSRPHRHTARSAVRRAA